MTELLVGYLGLCAVMTVFVGIHMHLDLKEGNKKEKK